MRVITGDFMLGAGAPIGPGGRQQEGAAGECNPQDMERALRVCPTMCRGVPAGAGPRETPGGVTVGA